MPPDDVIEAMTRALCEADGFCWEALPKEFTDWSHKRPIPPPSFYMDALRAAEAHDPPFKLLGREPSEDMEHAGYDHDAKNCWRAMWDAAPGVDKP